MPATSYCCRNLKAAVTGLMLHSSFYDFSFHCISIKSARSFIKPCTTVSELIRAKISLTGFSGSNTFFSPFPHAVITTKHIRTITMLITLFISAPVLRSARICKLYICTSPRRVFNLMQRAARHIIYIISAQRPFFLLFVYIILNMQKYVNRNILFIHNITLLWMKHTFFIFEQPARFFPVRLQFPHWHKERQAHPG